MAPAYILLAAPRTFWGFLGVHFLVAAGHGMFKPVVISTIVKTTTEETRSMGFGIFYMMVNIGGFIGPIVAGVDRPGAMWVLFAVLAITTAIGLVVYNRIVVPSVARGENQ